MFWTGFDLPGKVGASESAQALSAASFELKATIHCWRREECRKEGKLLGARAKQAEARSGGS